MSSGTANTSEYLKAVAAVEIAAIALTEDKTKAKEAYAAADAAEKDFTAAKLIDRDTSMGWTTDHNYFYALYNACDAEIVHHEAIDLLDSLKKNTK